MSDATIIRPIRDLSRVVFLLLALLASIAAQSGPNESASSVQFAAIGDSGTGKKEQFAIAQTMERAHEAAPFDLVLML
ncbi:MAG: hypothetical protein ACKVX9_00570, partial [Blastocatellia bacterium]